jgi:hypothetical protein
MQVRFKPNRIDRIHAMPADFNEAPATGASVSLSRGLAKAPIFPASETRFFTKAFQAEVTFDRPAGSAKARNMRLNQGTDELYGTRITVVQPTSERLAAYSGTYYSEELDTAYSVSVQAGQLHVRLPREDMQMIAGGKDVFYGVSHGSRLEVQFHCESARSCDAFQVSSGNGWVQNVHFRAVDLASR